MGGTASPVFTDEKGGMHYIELDLVQVTKKKHKKTNEWNTESLKSGTF